MDSETNNLKYKALSPLIDLALAGALIVAYSLVMQGIKEYKNYRNELNIQKQEEILEKKLEDNKLQNIPGHTENA